MIGRVATNGRAGLVERVNTLLTRPDPFARWLTFQPAGRVVGRRLTCLGCPLAMWLLAEGVQVWSVQPEEIAIDDPASDEVVRLPLPAWAQRFVARIDGVRNGDNPSYRAVTVGEALTALEAVLRELRAMAAAEAAAIAGEGVA